MMSREDFEKNLNRDLNEIIELARHASKGEKEEVFLTLLEGVLEKHSRMGRERLSRSVTQALQGDLFPGEAVPRLTDRLEPQKSKEQLLAIIEQALKDEREELAHLPQFEKLSIGMSMS